jgi:hypothetical protein
MRSQRFRFELDALAEFSVAVSVALLPAGHVGERTIGCGGLRAAGFNDSQRLATLAGARSRRPILAFGLDKKYARRYVSGERLKPPRPSQKSFEEICCARAAPLQSVAQAQKLACRCFQNHRRFCDLPRPAKAASRSRSTSRSPARAASMILLAMSSRTTGDCQVSRSSSQAASKAAPMTRVSASSNTTLGQNGRIDPTAPLPMQHTTGSAPNCTPHFGGLTRPESATSGRARARRRDHLSQASSLGEYGDRRDKADRDTSGCEKQSAAVSGDISPPSWRRK